jgi:hypothetical protein
MVKTRSSSGGRGEKRKASLDLTHDMSPLAEAVRRVSPFVSITPTHPPTRNGPSPRKRILVEDRLEVRPVPSTSCSSTMPSTSRGLSSTSSSSSNQSPARKRLRSSTNLFSLHSEEDSEDEELAQMEQRLIAEEQGKLVNPDHQDEDEDLPVGERVAYIHVSEGCEEDLEAQLKGAKNLDIQILEEECLPDIDESDMIHGLDHTGTSRDYVDERHRCSIQCPIGCQGHLRPNEIVIYESFKWNGRLRGRRR